MTEEQERLIRACAEQLHDARVHYNKFQHIWSSAGTTSEQRSIVGDRALAEKVMKDAERNLKRAMELDE